VQGYRTVPGNPLDTSVRLTPLEPARGEALGRDFMVKTRLRKGLDQDVSAAKFFDPELLDELVRLEEEQQALEEEEARAAADGTARQDGHRMHVQAVAQAAGIADEAVAAMFEQAMRADTRE
jgi:hypothetical protein